MRQLLLILALFLLIGQGCVLVEGERSEKGENGEIEQVTVEEDTLPSSRQPLAEEENSPEKEYDPEDIPVTKMPELKIENGVIMMRVGNFFFEPDKITIQLGDPVKIKFDEIYGLHNFVIDELDINEGVVAGQMLEFTPEEAGEYRFYCSVGSHEERGMYGTLIVDGPETDEFIVKEVIEE